MIKNMSRIFPTCLDELPAAASAADPGRGVEREGADHHESRCVGSFCSTKQTYAQVF